MESSIGKLRITGRIQCLTNFCRRLRSWALEALMSHKAFWEQTCSLLKRKSPKVAGDPDLLNRRGNNPALSSMFSERKLPRNEQEGSTHPFLLSVGGALAPSLNKSAAWFWDWQFGTLSPGSVESLCFGSQPEVLSQSPHVTRLLKC